MEAPPPISPPPVPPRRGRRIFVVVLVPLVLLGLGMAVAGGLHIKDSESYFGIVFIIACICSVLGATQLSLFLSESIPARVLIFAVSAVGLWVVYTFCICAGCSAVTGPVNFH